MQKPFIADMHAHSILQPFGQTFSKKRNNPKESLWFYNLPKGINKILSKAGLSSFSQSNLTAAGKGNTSLLGMSLYPPEISFFNNKLGEKRLPDALENLITRYSLERIAYIQHPGYNYFADLQQQYQFLIQYQNSISDNYKCKIIETGEQINDIDENTIGVFINIEGGHALDCGYPPVTILTDEQKNKILQNVQTIKNWQYRPFYISIAHHYYNQLVGHCRSLPFVVDSLTGQGNGMNTGFTPLGFQVLHQLLDNTNKKRILIDIKHLSVLARKEYYQILETDYASEQIPIIMSHGGVNGMLSFDDIGTVNSNSLFNNWDINIYDKEIIKIAKSNGIIGLNMDERIMGSKLARDIAKAASKCTSLKNKQMAWSKILWNHIQYIAVLLDREGLPAWDNIAIGSDYDGVINPIDHFSTIEDLPTLKECFVKHAEHFLNANPLTNANLLNPQTITDKIMGGNLKNFCYKYY
jgi:microsomal dipeptidase-like Zn-dependent dipeptidase